MTSKIQNLNLVKYFELFNVIELLHFCFPRFKYKDEYEKFKLILSVIGFCLSVINLITNVR